MHFVISIDHGDERALDFFMGPPAGIEHGSPQHGKRIIIGEYSAVLFGIHFLLLAKPLSTAESAEKI
jgi:hypothetical protein